MTRRTAIFTDDPGWHGKQLKRAFARRGYAADYLSLIGVRMGPRLQVVLDLPAALRTLPVPPLLLQPLVENGIQHGLEPKLEGGRIEVRATPKARGAPISTLRPAMPRPTIRLLRVAVTSR